MSNVLKLGKKFLTVSTVFSTILWSVGVATLVPAVAQAATCAPFTSGDMFKVVGKAAIYSVDSNGKVKYFPSGDEFKSWNANDSYGGYTSISQECYDAMPVSSVGVGFRPGSYVVKRPSSDQLYVVEPGNLLAKITPDAAKALYGVGYKVQTVADVFWPNYGDGTVRGAEVTEAKVHPGMLVSNGGKTLYVNADSKLQEVSDTGFTANRFKTAFVHSATDAMISGFALGDKIDAMVAAVTDRTQTGGKAATTPAPTTTPAPVTGTVSTGSLTVALASDNPAGGYLATKTAFNKVLKFTLTSSATSDTKVTSLKIRKSGFLANTQVAGIDVVDSAGVRHGNVITSLTADNEALITMSTNPIVVKAGASETITVRVNLSGTTSGVVQFMVNDAASVTTDGTSTVGGTFPVSGNQLSVQDGTSSVATVTLNPQAVNASGATLNVDPTNLQDIAKYQIQETSSKEALNLSKLTLYNYGTSADTDFKDVTLVDQAGSVLAIAQPKGKDVVFDLSAKPYFIDKGLTKTFTIRAKIINGSSRTIQFAVYNDFDLEAKGLTTGSFVLATTNSSAGNASTTSFPAGNATNYNKVTVGSGNLSFNKDSSSASNAVTPGTNNVELAKFFVKPTGEDYELRQIQLAITTSTGASVALTGTTYVKVNGAVVWSGTASGVSVLSGSPDTDTLSTYPTLKAGENSYITVESNISSSATANDAYRVYLNLIQAKRVITNDILSTAATLGVSQANGNSIAVNAGALVVTNLATPVAQNVVAGTNQFPIAKFELNAGSSGEDVKVTTLVVTSTFTGTTLTDIANLVMYDENGTALQTSNSSATFASSTTGVSFTFTTPILVTRATARTLTLKADFVTRTSAAAVTPTILGSSSVSATGATTGNTITATFGTGSGQAMTVQASGTVTLSLVSGTNGAPALDQVVNIGTTGNYVFAFKVSTQSEAMKVTTLKLTASSTAGGLALLTTNDVVNLKLYRNSETTPFATANQMTCASNTCTFTWTATDNLLPDPIQPSAPVTIYVKADIGSAGAAKLGEGYKFYIASSTTDVVAKGAYSNQAATVSGTPAAGGVTYIVPAPATAGQSTVVVSAEAPASGSSQTQAVIAGTQLARFKVVNNGTGQITVTQFKVTDSGTHTQTSTTLDLMFSDQNSSNYIGTTASSSVSSTAAVTFVGFTNAATIDGGGAYRYFTVRVAAIGGSVTGDSYAFSVASLGDVKYSVTESNLGYDNNQDGDLSDTVSSIFADGKPALGTLVKQ